MPIVFTTEGISDVPIGGFDDVVLTGELFERNYLHQDEDGVARNFTGLTVESAVIFDPLAPATTIQAITATFAEPLTSGILNLQVADADMPAAGQYSYRVRATNDTNLRTIQDGRFTVGDAAP